MIDMAYANLLAAVTPEQVIAFRSESKNLLRPSRVTSVSHLIGLRGWVEAQPLQSLLSRALDVGDLLAAQLWHPLREPLYHTPKSVRDISAVLAQAWGAFLAEHSLPEEDWYRVEIGKAVALFSHAAERGEGVVSILEPPYDAERAQRVQNPLEPM
jgi:hypothetical protein